jgi:predicted secreted protein
MFSDYLLLNARFFVFLGCGLVSLTAKAGVIYVNAGAQGQNSGSSWADAFRELTPAIQAAQMGDEIWVAQGSYYPPYDENLSDAPFREGGSFEMKSHLSLFGGFTGVETQRGQRDWAAHRTVLHGQPKFQPPSYRYISATIMKASAPVTDFLVEGFTFTGAIPLSEDSSGGAAQLRGEAEFRYCSFLSNSASTGGAIAVIAEEGDPLGMHRLTITNCLFDNNYAEQSAAIEFQPSSGELTIVQSTLMQHRSSGLDLVRCGPGVVCHYLNNVFDSSWQSWLGQRLKIHTGHSSSLVAHNAFEQTQLLPGINNIGLLDSSTNAYRALDGSEIYALARFGAAIGHASAAYLPSDRSDADGDGDVTEPLPLDLNHKPRLAAGALDAGALANHNLPPYEVSAFPQPNLRDGMQISTAVCILDGRDPNNDPLIFALAPGTGDVDNSRFTLDGVTLRLAEPYHFADVPWQSVRVRVTDSGGLSFEQVIPLSNTHTAVSVGRGDNVPLDSGAAFDFGAVAIGQTAKQDLHLLNRGSRGVFSSLSQVEGFDAQRFTLNTSPISFIGASGEATRPVSFTPVAPETSNASLKIYGIYQALPTSVPWIPTIYEVNLTGRGTSPRIEVREGTGAWLQSGEQLQPEFTAPAGSTLTRHFTLHNHSAEMITGLSVAKLGDTAGSFQVGSLSTTSLAPDATAQLSANFAPSDDGLFLARLRFTSSSDPANPFDLNLVGIGQYGRLRVTNADGAELPTALPGINFGMVSPSTTTQQTITISNVGHGSITGISPVLTASSAVFSLSQTSTQSDYAITFNPPAPGTYTATVRVDSSDALHGPTTFSLIGFAATPLEQWRLQHFATSANRGSSNDSADSDKDGISNLYEYAFGLNPGNSAGPRLPAPRMIGTDLVAEFTAPNGITGVTYGAEWSTTMASADWYPISDQGAGTLHRFSVPSGSAARKFMRLTVKAP